MLTSIRNSANPYRLVPREEVSDVDEKEVVYRPASPSPLSARWRAIAIVLGVFLTASLSANLMFLRQRFSKPWQLYDELPTKFAGLSRNVGRPIAEGNPYTNHNRTIQDAAWNATSFLSYSLYVALDSDYATSKGLPHAQRWPWDTSKGVYILTAAHEIHCVHVVRSLLADLHDGVPEDERLWTYPHAVHCLDDLRQSVMCNADDYPMYTGTVNANAHAEHPFPGNGVVKQCRNWDALVDWANEHSACYWPERIKDPDFDEIERYKYCPDGSRPWEDGHILGSMAAL